MNFLAIIPARYASTRFQGKPLASIFGKPMIQHVYEKTVAVFEHCVVATDDIRIEKAVQKFGGKVVMTSSSHKSGTDRCYEALLTTQKLWGINFDVVVNVQGDEPFVHTDQLQLIKKCFDDPQCKLATLIKPFAPQEDISNPNSPKVVVDKQGYALYFSRSVIPYLRNSDVPSQNWNQYHTYYKHIGLYAYKSETLKEITSMPQSTLEKVESLEQLRWIENGMKIKTAVTHNESHAIDTPEDLAFVLQHYKYE